MGSRPLGALDHVAPTPLGAVGSSSVYAPGPGDTGGGGRRRERSSVAGVDVAAVADDEGVDGGSRGGPKLGAGVRFSSNAVCGE